MPTVMLVGDFGPAALENSYRRGFEQLGWQVHTVAMNDIVAASVRLGRVGQRFSQFVPVEPWVRRVNARIVILAREVHPDLIVTFGMDEPLRVGSLGQIRTVLPNARLACIWPDTLVNWSTHLSAALPLFDIVASYSSSTLPVFEALGARKTTWLPFAADPILHSHDAAISALIPTSDVSFIGAWREGREELLSELTDVDLRIWGPGWGRRRTANPLIRRAWQGRALMGAEFAAAVQASKVNLNIIDPTNYPAGNMRIFELLAAGGLQLCSACPELEDRLLPGKHLFYFQDRAELPLIVKELLADPERRHQVATDGHNEVIEHHTYAHRARALIDACRNG
jgi:spore maturation protein CgeB